jgi:hypothetical protein
MGLPQGRPKGSIELGCSFFLGLWLRLRLGSIPRLRFRGEFLLDLESHCIGIDPVDLGGGAECLSAVSLASGTEQNHSFDNQLAYCAFVGFADKRC